MDEEGFRAAMREQQERARSGRKEGEEAAWSEDVYQKMDKSITTEFLGYDSLETDAKVLALVKDGEEAETVYAEEEAVLIDVAKVACVEPTIRILHLRSLLWTSIVALHDIVAFHAHFTVDYLNFIAGDCLAR